MHPIVRRLGFQGRDAVIANSFLNSIQHSGRSEREAVDLLRWYARTFGPSGKVSAVDVAQALSYHAEKSCVPAAVVDAAYSWHDVVSIRGPDAIAPLRLDPAKVAARLAEIDDLRKRDFDAYEQNQDLQDEEIKLLDMQSQGGPRSAPQSGAGFAPTYSNNAPNDSPQIQGQKLIEQR